MLIELLKEGEFKVGAFSTPSYQKYLLLFDLSNSTISIKFTTAPLSAFQGDNQDTKKQAQLTLLTNMRLQFLRECLHDHKIPITSEDYVDQKTSGDDTLIIKASGVIKLIDQLYGADKGEIYAQALWFIKQLLSKDKQKITESFNDAEFIEYDTPEQNSWNYIYVSPELNNMPKLAETVTKAMSLGIAYLINVNSRDVQETHHRIDSVDYKAVTLNDANYEKLSNIYDEIDEEEAKKQPEQMQPAPAPAAATPNGRPAPRRVPSKYQGKGATDSTPKPKPTRPAPPPPQKNSESSPATTGAQNSSGSALLLPPNVEASITTTSVATTGTIPPHSTATTSPPSNSSSLPRDLNSVFDLQSAKNFLDEHIYRNEARYVFKSNYLKLIKDTFNKLSTQNGDDIVANLCDLYDYINEKERKEKVNLRENPRYDTIFFKTNTKHWISTIREIRIAAYEKLIAFAIQKHSGHPEQQKSFLESFRNRKLFAEHLDNSIFNIFHDTNTVQCIDEQISLRALKLN